MYSKLIVLALLCSSLTNLQSQQIEYPIDFNDHLSCNINTLEEYNICFWYYGDVVNSDRLRPALQNESGQIFNRFADSLLLPFRILTINIEELKNPIIFDAYNMCSREIYKNLKKSLPENKRSQYDINIIVSNGVEAYRTSHYFHDFIYLHLLDVGPFRTLMHEIVHRYEKQRHIDRKHSNENLHTDMYNKWAGDISYNLMAQPNSEIFNFQFTKQQSRSMYENPINPLDIHHTLPHYLAANFSQYLQNQSGYLDFYHRLIELENTIIRSDISICSFDSIEQFLTHLKTVEHEYNNNKDRIHKEFIAEAEYIVKDSKMSAEMYAKMKIEKLEARLFQYRNIANAIYFLANKKFKISDLPLLQKLHKTFNETNKKNISFEEFYLSAKMSKK